MSIAGLYNRRQYRGDIWERLASLGQKALPYIGQGLSALSGTPTPGFGPALRAPRGVPGEEYFPGPRRRRSRGRGISGAQLRNYLRVAKIIRRYAPLARGTPKKARHGR